MVRFGERPSAAGEPSGLSPSRNSTALNSALFRFWVDGLSGRLRPSGSVRSSGRQLCELYVAVEEEEEVYV